MVAQIRYRVTPPYTLLSKVCNTKFVYRIGRYEYIFGVFEVGRLLVNPVCL